MRAKRRRARKTGFPGLSHDTELVEAAGVEPASRKQAPRAYYKLIPRFASRAGETPTGRINSGASSLVSRPATSVADW